jgi:hypothetical protein
VSLVSLVTPDRGGDASIRAAHRTEHGVQNDAGATKACGGPLTNEILPQAFEPTVRKQIEQEYYIDLLDRFLIDLPQQQEDRTECDYPALPLLLSVVDTAVGVNCGDTCVNYKCSIRVE